METAIKIKKIVNLRHQFTLVFVFIMFLSFNADAIKCPVGLKERIVNGQNFCMTEVNCSQMYCHCKDKRIKMLIHRQKSKILEDCKDFCGQAEFIEQINCSMKPEYIE